MTSSVSEESPQLGDGSSTRLCGPVNRIHGLSTTTQLSRKLLIKEMSTTEV